MTYNICTQPSTPRLDALPTYKIIDYPLETRDYKPFAQTRLCVTPAELMVQMWAFEMVPSKESTLEAVFTTASSQKLLFARCAAEGKVSCFVRTPQGDRPLTAISHSLSGEDLQGIYWGITITLPRTLLEELFGKGAVDVGSTLLGNIYKLSDNKEKPHKGSLAPADFAGGREYALGSMAEFKIVNY
ncbi:MAG: hypothetical protein RR528_00235 [Angelakisella sp.]